VQVQTRVLLQQLLMVLLQSLPRQACWQQHQQPWQHHKQHRQQTTPAVVLLTASTRHRLGTCLPTSWTL
jgi:hypothetical protein